MSRAFAGGRELPDMVKASWSGRQPQHHRPTPSAASANGATTRSRVATVKGIRPDGSKLARTMPFDWYARMAPGDLDDIVAYLRTVKPAK